MATGLDWRMNSLTGNFEFSGVIDGSTFVALGPLDSVDQLIVDSCFADGATIGDRLRGLALLYDRLEEAMLAARH